MTVVMVNSHQEVKQEVVTPREYDEPMLNLEDTFAFLDSVDLNRCDAQADSPTVFPRFSIPDYRDLFGGTMPVKVEQKSGLSGKQSGQPRQRRKIVRVVDRPKVVFKRPRKQHRIEILKLHKEVGELEAQLLDLKQRRQELQVQELTAVHASMSACGANALLKVAGTWLGRAAVQYNERQNSETMNRKLKACLGNQVQLSKTLATFFQKESSVEDLLVGSETLKDAEPEVSLGSSPMSSASYTRTEKLHDETDRVIDEIKADNDISTMFSTGYTKSDAVLGSVYELKSNTPIPDSDFRSLGAFFWAHLANNDRDANVGAAGAVLYPADRVKSETDPAELVGNLSDAHDISYTFKLPTRLGDVKVNGSTSVRRFDDPDRIVFTYASKIKVSGTKLVFRENGWLILSPSNSAQHMNVARTTREMALFQTLYRLHTEKRASINDPGTAADQMYLEELVMDALSNKMRIHQHHLQSLILKGVV